VESHIGDVLGVSNSDVIMPIMDTLDHLVHTSSWSKSMSNWAPLWNHLIAGVADLEVSIAAIISPYMVPSVVVQTFSPVPTSVSAVFFDHLDTVDT
jgi:hypothetical protein